MQDSGIQATKYQAGVSIGENLTTRICLKQLKALGLLSHWLVTVQSIPHHSLGCFPWMQLQWRGRGLSHGSLITCICLLDSHLIWEAQRTSASWTDHRASHKHYVCLIRYLSAYNGGPGRSPLKVVTRYNKWLLTRSANTFCSKSPISSHGSLLAPWYEPATAFSIFLRHKHHHSQVLLHSELSGGRAVLPHCTDGLVLPHKCLRPTHHDPSAVMPTEQALELHPCMEKAIWRHWGNTSLCCT